MIQRLPRLGRTLATVVGRLASTGLRSGEALRLDRGDVDRAGGVMQLRKTKFRKDRLVPVHATTLAESMNSGQRHHPVCNSHESEPMA
jgi:integrase